MSSQTTFETYGSSSAKLPMPHAQPDFLATVARLRGLQPPPVDQAAVLEIGCADGGNLLPLAERYPEAKFLGIDESARHIAVARAEAAALGLANVAFFRQSVFDLDAAAGQFDYIIADGIYSSAGTDARDRLLAVFHERLTPHGVAYVDYLAYPGWRVHELLGAMMRFEAHGSDTIAQQVAAGRMLLEFLQAELPGEENPYGALLRAELPELLKQPDAFLYRNYMQQTATGVYLRDFVAQARRHQLQFLGDCTAGILYGDFLNETAERDLAAVTSDPLEREHVRDIVRNRTYRQTLLCHQGVELSHTLATEQVRELFLEARFTPQTSGVAINSTAVDTFEGPGGVSVSTGVPSTKAALAHLLAIRPGAIRFDELVTQACALLASAEEEPTETTPAEVRRLEENLLQCCAGEIVSLSTAPPAYSSTVSDRPKASPLARQQALRGDLVTNRKHQTVRLDLLDRHVLQYLDGSRSVAELIEDLAVSATVGHIAVVEHYQPVEDPATRLRVLGELVPQCLRRLADHALLIG